MTQRFRAAGSRLWTERARAILLLALLTLLAVAVHGYHLGVEDQAIYLPAIKKHLDPQLYPHDSAFFEAPSQRMLFDELIAFSIWGTGLPLPLVILLWHGLSVFVVLLACWQLARRCFVSPAAQWAGVLTVAALLTIPVAGTALYLMDQYLHPRSLATPALLFAVVAALECRRAAVVPWLVFAALMHPQMAFYGAGLLILLIWRPQKSWMPAAALLAGPIPLLTGPHSEAWRQALLTRRHHFLLRWEWYEWLGIVAPLALLWWFGSEGRRRNLHLLERISRRLLLFGLAGFAAALLITVPPYLRHLAPLQPMRTLHLVYLIFFLLAGGLLGDRLLNDKPWRWLLLFVPVCGGMFFAQRQLFAAGAHVDWPGARPRNAWVEAFQWVRGHTPRDALFALGPNYVSRPGEDFHGFRALAERSMLADGVKDAGPAASFPPLATAWHEQLQAQLGWDDFQAADFERLKQDYGVSWIVWDRPPPGGFPCPYQNEAVAVCQIP